MKKHLVFNLRAAKYFLMIFLSSICLYYYYFFEEGETYDFQNEFLINEDAFDLNLDQDQGNFSVLEPERITLVTAYFDIGRSERPATKYLEWMNRTSSILYPLVIYTQPRFVDLITEMMIERSDRIKIVPVEVSDLYYYKYFQNITEIQNSFGYKWKMKVNSRIECVNPYYPVVQYSKFDLLQRTILANPFDSVNFAWIDAGLSRFFNGANVSKPWKRKDTSKLHVKAFKSGWSYTDKQLMFDHRAFIAGSFFYGSESAIKQVADGLEKVFLDMIHERGINNEQIGLEILFNRNPEYFKLLPHSSSFGWGYDDVFRYLQNNIKNL